ncbi:MAG: isoprenylcysteine carboxylmethyltransferase family protein [Planctomycetota bacterium]
MVQILSLFVVLEPIWMLLPFAGFLYGSLLRIETLAGYSKTAWLTHFVFPVLTLGPVGPALVLIGLVVFLVGAGQIYLAKLRRTGLVTRGLYRWVRNPQYSALTLFGIGILLTWGRAITFLAFFLMMFLYYHLSKSEEGTCLQLFGEEYRSYRARTSFCIPGDRYLARVLARVPPLPLPAPIRVMISLVLTLMVACGLIWLIGTAKLALRNVPYLAATVQLTSGSGGAPSRPVNLTAGEAAGVQFVQSGRLAVVRGPYRNARQPGFAERLLVGLQESKTLKGFLAFLDESNRDAAIVFCGPYDKPDQPGTPGMHRGQDESGRRGPAPDEAGTERVRAMIIRCRLAEGAAFSDALADKSNRQIIGACIAPVNLDRPQGEDIVEGQLVAPGRGFPGEERWDFFMQQLAASADVSPGQPVGVVTPGAAASAELILVKAPILRTRLDPDFAREILDRLVKSNAFRNQLRKNGVGGDVVAVAFPTPGPNWYREHHGRPQINVCVMLARLPSGAGTAQLFGPDGPGPLLGAFFADMDFKIEPPEDSIVEIRPLGPRRDLSERWKFFLSGV